MRNGGRRTAGASNRAHESRLADDADVVAHRTSGVRKRIGEWSETLARQTREHPGRTAALALGAGYLLGGGLFSRLTARVVGTGLRIGLRVALVPFVTQSLVTLGEGLLVRDAVDDADDGASDVQSETPSHQRHSDQKET